MNAQEALEFVETHGVVLVAARGPVPRLTEAIAGEPIKGKRQSMGVFVTLFLLVFFVFAYLLKKEYWKDVH